MEKNEIMSKIKEIVYQIIGIQIEDENDNILGCHHKYPLVYAVYVVDELEKIYGKGVLEIFEKNDYNIWKLSNLADAILNILENFQHKTVS